ncbi:MAG: hypothetical protein ABJB03_06415 [Rhodoglobus sp.]
MTTADSAVPVVAEPKRGIRFGLWALIFGLIPPVMTGLGLLFALLGEGKNGSEAVATTAYVLLFSLFLVVPVCVVLAIIFGILALRRNRALGKILGAIGIVLVIAVVVVSLVLLLGSNGPLSWTNF